MEAIKAINFKTAIENDGEIFCKASTEEYTYKDITFEITNIIPITEMMTFVESVVQSCFEGGTGEYLPEIRDFAIMCEIFNRYTNIELPEDINERYMFVYQASELVNEICNVIDTAQFNHIVAAINAKLAYRAQEGFEAQKKQIGDLANSFNMLSDKFEEMLGSIDQETMNNLVNAMIDGFNGNEFVAKYMETAKQGDK